METKLLPCPFCGGEGCLYHGTTSPYSYVYCEVCQAETMHYSDDYDADRDVLAMTAWNRRAADKEEEL